MPVRCRIHSSVVSMRRDIRAFVTTPSGTNMPEPRTTVRGRVTCPDYRKSGGRPAHAGPLFRPRLPKTRDLEVSRSEVDLLGRGVDVHPGCRLDPDARRRRSR